MEKKVHYELHHDSEGVDEIRMKVIPRFKTSEMSGDEWRVSTRIEFVRKGVVVYTRSFHKLKDAAQFLPWVLNVEMLEGENAPEDGLFRADPKICFQPGCAEPSINEYRLKQRYTAQGEGPLEIHKWEDPRRAFCQKHSHRGDSDLEDCDSNYELVKGEGHKTLAPGDISPSAFGGVVELES